MSINMSSSLRDDLKIAEYQFRRACQEVLTISRQLEELAVRYDAADRSGNRCLRYCLKLRLSVLEGVRNMFYEFAAMKTRVINELHRHILTAEQTDADDGVRNDVEEETTGYLNDSMQFC